MQVGEKYYDNFVNINYRVVDDKFCDEIIKYYNLRKDQKAFHSRVGTDSRLEPGIRNSTEMIPWGENLVFKIREVLNPFVEDYLNYYSDIPVTSWLIKPWYEPPHILKYKHEDAAHYDWHADILEKNINQRVLSIILYLNDVDHGGETEFKHFQNKPVKPSKGTILIFPSEKLWLHRGNAPVSGDKFICVSWLRNRLTPEDDDG